MKQLERPGLRLCEVSRGTEYWSARVCVCVYMVAVTLTRELSSLREKCRDVECGRTSSQDLVEHRLQ